MREALAKCIADENTQPVVAISVLRFPLGLPPAAQEEEGAAGGEHGGDGAAGLALPQHQHGVASGGHGVTGPVPRGLLALVAGEVAGLAQHRRAHVLGDAQRLVGVHGAAQADRGRQVGDQQFLDAEAEGIAAFRDQQRAAFDAERQRWIASGQAHFEVEEIGPDLGEDAPLGAGQHGIDSHIAGNLWQVQVEEGHSVKAGDVLVILESMKMEIPLLAPRDGVVREVRVQPGSPVRAGQRVVVLEEA